MKKEKMMGKFCISDKQKNISDNLPGALRKTGIRSRQREGVGLVLAKC